MSLLTKLPQWFETKPLMLLRFEDGYEAALKETRHGLGRFTVVKRHGAFKDLSLPSLCLAEMREAESSKFYVGVVKSKAAVGTFDSRITVLKLQSLNLASFDALADGLDGQIFKTLLKDKLATGHFATVLSPKLSVAIIDALAKDAANKNAIEAAAAHVPKLRQISAAEWEQLDAIKTAMAAFGLSKSDFPEILEVADDSDSTLGYLDSHSAHVLEDNVIAKDASMIPGFELVEKHVTGRAVFLNSGERLEVYTANKGPLEEMLGVDLIYINETAGNTVMVQYKMLTAQTDPTTVKTDWIFRPDEQFESEVGRMRLPDVKAKPEDYRLHRSPFFFKFVKRKGDGESHASFAISLDHLNHFRESPESKGPKGGVRVSFDSLKGVYLREMDLLGLIRSGYVGTHRIETDALKPIIQAVSEGKRALVLAWQKTIEREGEP
jgi:hypothetical protein